MRALRKRAGLTQEQVALRANLDRTTVGRWERCERGIRFIQLQRVLLAMGATLQDFGREMDARRIGGAVNHGAAVLRIIDIM